MLKIQLCHHINCILKYIITLLYIITYECKYIKIESQYSCIHDQINTALVSIRYYFQKHSRLVNESVNHIILQFLSESGEKK